MHGRSGGRVFVLNAGGAAVTMLYLGNILQGSLPQVALFPILQGSTQPPAGMTDFVLFTVYGLLLFAAGALITLAIPHFTKLAWEQRHLSEDDTAAERYVRRARALAALSALSFAAGVGLVAYALLSTFL